MFKITRQYVFNKKNYDFNILSLFMSFEKENFYECASYFRSLTFILNVIVNLTFIFRF